MSQDHPDPHAFDDDSPTQVDDLAFVLSSSNDRGPDQDPTRSVLQVHQIWGQALLDTVHAHKGTVTVGAGTGYRWKMLGRDLGWVSLPLARILPFAPPLLSDVTSRPLADLCVSDPALDDADVQVAFEQAEGGAWNAVVHPGWGVRVVDADGVHDEAALIADGRLQASGATRRLDVADEADVTLLVGEVELHARLVPASKRIVSRWYDGIDLIFLGLLGVAAVIGAAFGLLVAALPSPPEASHFELPEHFAQVLQEPKADEPPAQKAPQGDLRAAAPAPREPGKAGKQDAPHDRAQGAAKARQDREVAEKAGLLGFLNDLGANAGMGGGLEVGLLDDIGGVIGVKGSQRGNSGLTSRGNSLGGGGTVDGLGGIGLCTGDRSCVAKQYGRHDGVGGAKAEGRIQVPESERVVMGPINASLIDEVIKRHIEQIRYCYQRQLVRDPTLGGKVVSRFTIAGDGTVSSASTRSNTTGSLDVSSCIEGRILRMQFPKLAGGNLVVVSYPFSFSSQ